MDEAPPSHSAITGPSLSEPMSQATAASPVPASSAEPGRPVRTSLATTSVGREPSRAARSAALTERAEPATSPANTYDGRSSAAWMTVAFVLSR